MLYIIIFNQVYIWPIVTKVRDTLWFKNDIVIFFIYNTVIVGPIGLDELLSVATRAQMEEFSFL